MLNYLYGSQGKKADAIQLNRSINLDFALTQFHTFLNNRTAQPT